MPQPAASPGQGEAHQVGAGQDKTSKQMGATVEQPETSVSSDHKFCFDKYTVNLIVFLS